MGSNLQNQLAGQRQPEWKDREDKDQIRHRPAQPTERDPPRENQYGDRSPIPGQQPKDKRRGRPPARASLY